MFGSVLALLYALPSVPVPTANTRTRVRRKPVPRETRVPTAMPAPDRTRLERWVALRPGAPAGDPAGTGGPGAPGGLAGVGVKVGCGRGGWAGPGGGWPVVLGTRRQPGGDPGGPGDGERYGRVGGAGHLSASGSVVSAGLGPPPGIGPSIGGSGSGAACRPRRSGSASPEPGSSGLSSWRGSSGHGSSGHGILRPRRLLAAGLFRPGIRRRRPSVVHRPGHPVPPSGVAHRWCQSRRYPVGPPLR